jgi:hypothetical protein
LETYRFANALVFYPAQLVEADFAFVVLDARLLQLRWPQQTTDHIGSDRS